MGFGENLCQIRKKRGITQEYLAEYLDISRQTISKWEQEVSLPDIYQVNKMAQLFQIEISELLKEKEPSIEKIIQNTTEHNVDSINWTKAWSGKYPILQRYSNEVCVLEYSKEVRLLLEKLKRNYHYSELEAMLVLKDILYQEWKTQP